MYEPPPPNSQESDRSDRSFPVIGFWMLRAIALLIATLGTTGILAFFLKFNQTVTAVEPSTIQPIAPKKLAPIQVTTQQAIAPIAPPQPKTQPAQTPLPQVTLQAQLPSFERRFAPRSNARLKKDFLDYLKLVQSKQVTVAIAEPPQTSSKEPNIAAIATVTEASLQFQFPTNQPAPQLEAPGISLTLSDVVYLALENNRDIKNAYLERIADKQDLAVEEGKFNPIFTPEISASITRQDLGDSFTHSRDLGVSAIISVNIPTGGKVSFGWTGSGRSPISDRPETNSDELRQNLQLSFNQPLLRGFGVAVNRASIEIARLAEKSNLLTLKSTLSDTITEAILAYRQLVQSQEQVKIQQTSLENARQQLEITRALIEAGRLARVDILQNEADVASLEVNLLEAETNLESVRLQLLDILDINNLLKIIASEIPSVNNTPDLSNLKSVAFANNPSYLQAQLNVEIAKYDLLVADNNRRWNLDFNASYGNSVSTASDKTGDVRAGLTFRRELGDRTIEQRFERSRVNLLQSENTLENQRDSLELQITDRIREVNSSFRQVQLAKRARELSEQKLQNEQEKLRLGLGSARIIDIVNFQDDLVQAKNAELSATIAYLNALTNLDRAVGTTLETWQVRVESEEEKREKGEGKRDK